MSIKSSASAKWHDTCHIQKLTYHNDPKFLDRYARADSAEPDQTAPLGAV